MMVVLRHFEDDGEVLRHVDEDDVVMMILRNAKTTSVMMLITQSLSMILLSDNDDVDFEKCEDNVNYDDNDDDNENDDDDHPIAVHDGVEPVCNGQHCAVRELFPGDGQHYHGC